MKRMLTWLIGLPLAVLAGLFTYAWWRERGFNADHPPPGRLYGRPGAPKAHAIDRMGAEPTVVFLHGNPGSCLDFVPVMERLSPGVRSFAFDRPGYGWSERPKAEMSPVEQARIIHAALEHQGISKPVLVGFSFGGAVALAYALEFRADVSALVLVAAVGNPDEKHVMSPAQARLAEPVGPLIAWSLGPIVGPFAVEDGYVAAFSPRPVDPEVVERGRWLITRPPSLLASARDWRVLERELPLLATHYDELALPVEILSANQDQVVGPRHAEYLAAHLQQAHLAFVDQAGHQLMSTHTDAVVAAVQRAVARSKP